MSSSLHSILAVLHALTGAVWLGAMCYSFFILHPRAHTFFTKEADFESFIATVSRGARWKVLGALGLIALSGAGLVVVRWPDPFSVTWLVLIGLKAALLIAAVGLFVYVSWRLWPARLFATPEEIGHFQRTFRRVAIVMMTLAALGMTLGILSHTG